MKRTLASLLVVTAASLYAADNPASPLSAPRGEGNREPASFRFNGGDAEKGREAFVALQCTQCHIIQGVELLKPVKRRLDLSLASEPRFVKRYEDLITAITSPKHVVTERYKAVVEQVEPNTDVEPFMPSLSENMSARQLIDLVTFLHDCYSKTHPGYQK